MADWGSLAPWLADNTDVFTTPNWREREAAQTAAALGLSPAKPQAPQKPQMLDDARASDFVSNMFRNASATGMAKGIYESGKDAIKLPGDAYAGRVDPNSDEAIKRSMNLGLTLPLMSAVPLGIAGGIERNALAMNAPTKIVGEQRIVPALRRGDEILTGGANHGEVAAKHDYFPTSADDSGFQLPDGRFVDRNTAFEWLHSNEPQVAGGLKKNVWARKLESNDLNRARGEVLGPDAMQGIIDDTAKNGGVSVNLKGERPSSGLMVGRFANDDARTSVIEGDLTPAHINDFVKKNADVLKEPDSYIGTWRNPDDGKTYLDVSRRFEPDQMDQASAFGKSTKQLSGYDVGAGKTFDLMANGKQAAPLSLAAAVSEDIPFDMPIKTGSGKQTVLNPTRNEFPGIYGDPREIAREAASRVAPEDPALKQLFGVTRDDLYEIGERGTRPGNMEPSFMQGAGKSKQAQQVMTPENAERIRNVLFEGEKYPELVKGMDSWYVMDPAFKRLEELVGTEEAIKRYNSLNTYMSMASPGSEVLTEINRGSAANFMATQGRFDDFEKFGGIAEGMRRKDFPRDIREIVSHPYHKTAHAGPMRKYHDSGKVEMQSVKVPLYMQASGVPQTGFQTKLPVPDAHFTRALGVPDVRTAEVTKNASMKPAIYTPIGPWYRDNVAHPLGIEPVPAQARQWGLFAPQTGVDTPIGAPKLELIARRISEQAHRRGIDPERLRDEVLLGKNLAVNPAELAPFGLGYAGERD